PPDPKTRVTGPDSSPTLRQPTRISRCSCRVRLLLCPFVSEPCTRGDCARNVLRISTHTVHRRRSHGIKKLQAKKVQARHDGGHAAMMPGIAIYIEYRKVNPRKAGLIPSAPDHVRDIEGAAVFQQGNSSARTHHPRNTLDPGSCQVMRFDPYQRGRSMQELGPLFLPDWIT